MKTLEKERALSLRREGKTYSEILSEVPVTRSTLSTWLCDEKLATPQKQRITEKRRVASLRGATIRHEMRVKEAEFLKIEGKSIIGELSDRELLLVGTALYWSEGSKQNTTSPSTGIVFSNQDEKMIRVFICWLQLLGIEEKDLVYELYIHENRKDETESFKQWWADMLGVPIDCLDRVYLKRGNPNTNRINVHDLYHGQFRIKVKASTALNRKVQGLIHGIVTNLGSGVIGNTSAFEAEDSRIVP